MTLFNNGFKPNFTYIIRRSDKVNLRTLRPEIEFWALKFKIRMKLRLADSDEKLIWPSFNQLIAYFEDEMDLAAFKLKFNV